MTAPALCRSSSHDSHHHSNAVGQACQDSRLLYACRQSKHVCNGSHEQHTPTNNPQGRVLPIFARATTYMANSDILLATQQPPRSPQLTYPTIANKSPPPHLGSRLVAQRTLVGCAPAATLEIECFGAFREYCLVVKTVMFMLPDRVTRTASGTCKRVTIPPDRGSREQWLRGNGDEHGDTLTGARLSTADYAGGQLCAKGVCRIATHLLPSSSLCPKMW